MLSRSQLFDGAAVTLALSAARRYRYGKLDYSIWCLVAGLAAAQAAKIEDMLPSSVEDALGKVSIVTPGQAVAAVVGGLALEMSMDGLQLSDVSSLGGSERIIVGAIAAAAGIWASRMVQDYMQK